MAGCQREFAPRAQSNSLIKVVLPAIARYATRLFLVCLLWVLNAMPGERRIASVVQHNAQKGSVDVQAVVVLDEPQFLELVHEKIHPRPRGADHLRQRFL